MLLDREQAILWAEQARGESWRPGIACLPFPLHAFQIGPQTIRQIRPRNEITNACDAALRFARAQRFWPANVVQPWPCVHVHDAKGLLFASEMQEHCNHS